MNFRLIVEYHDTGIITEQYFPDMDTPDTIINCRNGMTKSAADEIPPTLNHIN